MSAERSELIRRAAAAADLVGDVHFTGSSLAPADSRTSVDRPRLSGEAATLPTRINGPAAILQDHPTDAMVRVAFNVTAEDWHFLMASGTIDPWDQVMRLADRVIHFTSEDPNAQAQAAPWNDQA